MSLIIKKITILFLLIVMFFPFVALAQDEADTTVADAASTQLNPLGTTSVPEVVGRVIKTLMGVLGTVGIIMIIYGGVMWMTSGGSGEKDKKAFMIMVWAALGIFLILSSYVVVNFIFEGFKSLPADSSETTTPTVPIP